MRVMINGSPEDVSGEITVRELLAEKDVAEPDMVSVEHNGTNPGLPSSPYHALVRRQFGGRGGGILALHLGTREACFRFLNGLALVSRASNLGDNTTLALHAASTIFAGLTAAELDALGVDDTLIRISFGIEDPEDLIDDLGRALAGVETT